MALSKNPELQIIRNFTLLQLNDCVRLVNISNKIVFNFSEPNEYSLCCDCSWIYKGLCDDSNWVRYAPDYYLIKNEYVIKYQEQTFWNVKIAIFENENERGQYL